MHARFIAAARLEFLAEVVYCSEAQPGLGERFAAAVEEATARAVGFPLSGAPSRAKLGGRLCTSGTGCAARSAP